MSSNQVPPARNPVPARQPAAPTLTVIGLAGRAGAGKDSCADILVARYQFVRLAFADALRLEIQDGFWVDPALFGVDMKEVCTPALAIGRCNDAQFIKRMVALGINPAEPRSARQIMQWWGTEYRRHQDEHYWARRLTQKIDQLCFEGHNRFVVTDVRFPNEAHTIKQLGGKLWLIRRKQAECLAASHVSEQLIDSLRPDVVVRNDESLSVLNLSVSLALNQSLSQAHFA